MTSSARIPSPRQGAEAGREHLSGLSSGDGLAAEDWRQVPQFPEYEVSSLGRVRIIRSGKIVRICRTTDGYSRVSLSNAEGRTTFRMHRLILMTFVGPRPTGMCGCHHDRNRQNNAISNLRWDTFSNNNAEKIRHGTARAQPRKLKAEDVRRIREAEKFGAARADLASVYGVARNTILTIVNRQSWARA